METASEQIAAGGRNTVTIDPRVSVESRRIDEPRVYILYTRTIAVRALDQTDLTEQIKFSQLYNDIFFSFSFSTRHYHHPSFYAFRNAPFVSSEDQRQSVKAAKQERSSPRFHRRKSRFPSSSRVAAHCARQKGLAIGVRAYLLPLGSRRIEIFIRDQ